MTETVPDPATRDLLREAWLKGSDEGAAITAHGDRVNAMAIPTFDEWVASKFPPPLPPEPPPGVYAGALHDVWQRHPKTDPDVWFKVGSGQIRTWAQAHADGADPTSRLVELPEPDDDAAVHNLTAALYGSDVPPMGGASAAVVRKLLRALTERGPA